MESGLVEAGPVRLDQTELPPDLRPHQSACRRDGLLFDGSNVDLVIEIADAREAQRSYEANLKLFDQARQMTQSLFDLLRR
jgi:flagellar basal-body rod protein FlgC